MPLYLADTSIWGWVRREGPLREKLAERVLGHEVVTCVPVALEYLHNARDGAEYDDHRDNLRQLEWLPVTAEIGERALELQSALAHTTHGAHRLPAVDYLIAAIAEQSDAVLWHVDRDLARVCELTGQQHEHESVRGSG